MLLKPFKGAVPALLVVLVVQIIVVLAEVLGQILHLADQLIDFLGISGHRLELGPQQGHELVQLLGDAVKVLQNPLHVEGSVDDLGVLVVPPLGLVVVFQLLLGLLVQSHPLLQNLLGHVDPLDRGEKLVLVVLALNRLQDGFEVNSGGYPILDLAGDRFEQFAHFARILVMP